MSFKNTTMEKRRPLGRVVGAAVILAATVATLPLAANAVPVHHGYRHHTAEQKRETVEARIASLHTQLMITSDEEADWGAVAQVIRANEAVMQARVAQEKARPPHSRTAVEDMQTYEAFTQAHVENLKSLISSFEVLYAAMPAPQQAVADRVFRTLGHKT